VDVALFNFLFLCFVVETDLYSQVSDNSKNETIASVLSGIDPIPVAY